MTEKSAADDEARRRMLTDRSPPLFYANWDHAVFIHYEADPSVLKKCVPFPLDLYDGRAFVSIVAFTLRDMRPGVGGKISEWLFKPIATHPFFNVRSYVRYSRETGIYFMAEWLSNRLSVMLGPGTFGLPYRFGRVEYANDGDTRRVHGSVSAKEGRFEYHASVPKELAVCGHGSLSEFLLERYTAFTSAGRRKQFFHVWHPPWQQTAIEVEVDTDDLLAATGEWWRTAQLIAANYSPGVSAWMGWPHLAKRL